MVDTHSGNGSGLSIGQGEHTSQMQRSRSRTAFAGLMLCLALWVPAATAQHQPTFPIGRALLTLSQLIGEAPVERRPGFYLGLATYLSATPEAREAYVTELLRSVDFSRHKDEILELIVESTGVVQGISQEYQALVHDSSILLFANLPEPKLVHKIGVQFALPPTAPVGQRLVLLIEDMPTLQKLGQTMARSSLIGLEFRNYLIGLESGMKTDAEAFRRILEAELGDKIRQYDIRVDPEPLAAASIAQVIRFEWPQPSGQTIVGVFKVHKPGVRQNLADEIAAISVVVEYFESHRERYPLEQFDLRGLLKNLTDALDRDVNSHIEQENLDEARKSFEHHQGLHIPRRFPELTTENVLAMEFIRGGKIVKAFRDQPKKRRQLAWHLLKYTVWHALYHDGFFHADPHAGNVFYEPAADGGEGKIAFLDWSLAARLGKEERRSMVALIIAIERGKVRRVMKALQSMSESDLSRDIDGKALEDDIRWILADYLGRPKLAPKGPKPPGAGMLPADIAVTKKQGKPQTSGQCVPPVTALDYVLDRALARGVGFKQEILLFRKATITVDAIVCDLSPELTRQGFLKKKVTIRMLIELPKRIVMLPWPNSRKFKSMVSNAEFFGLLGQKLADIFR